MTLHGAPDVAFVLLGGRSIMGDVIEISDANEAVVEETTPNGQAYDSWAYVGVTRSRMTLRGIYSDSGVVTALAASGAQELMYGLEGNTIGNDFVGMDALRITIQRNTQRDQLHRVEADFVPANGMDKGVILASLAARSDTDETTAVDNGGSSSGGAVGYLGVSALTLGGYDDVTIKIRDSSDDISYADHIAFSDVSSAPASERATSSGTVDQYAKVTVTFNGSGSGESITFAAGMRRL